MKLLVAVLGFLLTLSFDTAASVAQTGTSWGPVPCSIPCVIQNSPGGVVFLFEAQARQLKHDKTPIIVDGPCFSACTILVDIARDTVCLTRNALLGYHKSWNAQTKESGAITYTTPGLTKYINSRGGLPEPDSIMLLNYSEATQFYKPCHS